jgi:CheY-like chemotaxis protein
MVKRLVLIVEDEEPLREAACLKLVQAGYETLSAGTAEAALTILEKRVPAIIWLDLLMPGMGGFQFLEKLRGDDRWRNIPVIVVSVSGSPEKIRQAFELNVVDYIVKSQYRIEDIIKKLNDLIPKLPN